MTEKPTVPEQTTMDLSVPNQPTDPETEEEYNVFRPDDIANGQKDLIRRHMLWMGTLRKECPSASVPYRIGVYIRYFNQTKYENYLDQHIRHFRETIALCPRWTLVDFYIDSGPTAPYMENAPEWCRLLDDCFSGKVNLIVTQKIKSVSRNPRDLAMIARLLAAQEEPVGIYFISEDIFTLASYHTRDLRETDFLPEGWKPLPDGDEETPQLPGGNHAE